MVLEIVKRPVFLGEYLVWLFRTQKLWLVKTELELRLVSQNWTGTDSNNWIQWFSNFEILKKPEPPGFYKFKYLHNLGFKSLNIVNYHVKCIMWFLN